MVPHEPPILEVNVLLRKLPQDRIGRWNVLRRFFKGWYGEIDSSDGYTEEVRVAQERLGITFPEALREWYMLAGRRRRVWSCQDEFLSPESLEVEDHKLIIYVEAQCVVRWAIPFSGISHADPPVLVSDPHNSKEWILESPAVSIFALSQMLLGVKFSDATTYSADGQATDDALAVIARNYERLGFPDLHWPPGPTRIYGDRELSSRPMVTHGYG